MWVLSGFTQGWRYDVAGLGMEPLILDPVILKTEMFWIEACFGETSLDET